MRGLIARILAGQAPLPAPDPLLELRAGVEAGIAQRRAARLARTEKQRSRRFEHARPKVEQLRSALTQHAQKLRDEAGA
jgi:hypothetical protein